MKKKVLSLLLTVAMTASLLVGCGSGNAAETTDAATEEAAPEEETASEDAADTEEVCRG